jgi:hypothetical protein
MRQGQALQRRARNDRHLGARQRLDVVVREIEKQMLEIERLAGNVQRHDLPQPVAGDLLAKRIARNQHRAMLETVALADEIGGCIERADMVRQGPDRLAITSVERRMGFELPDHQRERR